MVVIEQAANTFLFNAVIMLTHGCLCDLYMRASQALWLLRLRSMHASLHCSVATCTHVFVYNVISLHAHAVHVHDCRMDLGTLVTGIMHNLYQGLPSVSRLFRLLIMRVANVTYV